MRDKYTEAIICIFDVYDLGDYEVYRRVGGPRSEWMHRPFGRGFLSPRYGY